MPGSRACNQQNDSKREVTCGLCGQNGRRDNLKMKHFPRKHPGVKYVEKGDKQLKNVKDFFVTKNKTVDQDARVQSDDESMESADESNKVPEVEIKDDKTNAEKNSDILNGIHRSIDNIEKKLDNLNLNADK